MKLRILTMVAAVALLVAALVLSERALQIFVFEFGEQLPGVHAGTFIHVKPFHRRVDPGHQSGLISRVQDGVAVHSALDCFLLCAGGLHRNGRLRLALFC